MKQLYLTLDFEEDGGSATSGKTYFCHENSADLIRLVKERNLQVIIFVTGEILDNHQRLLDPYLKEENHFQFGSHAYNHDAVYQSVEQRLHNIQKGLDAYSLFFSRQPCIYRAPDGIISKAEVEFLDKNQIHFGANIFPCFFPGRFNNLHIPRTPFKYKELNFHEIPFSTTKLLRIPISLSYIQLTGLNFFKLLMLAERPEMIVFDFHLHDIYPQKWYSEHRLPLLPKVAYYKNTVGNHAINVLKNTLSLFDRYGYKSQALDKLLGSITAGHLQEISLNEVFR